jgi:pyrimidine deaminase RibD-like protein
VVVLKDGQVLSQFATAEFGDAHALAAHYHDVVRPAPVTNA